MEFTSKLDIKEIVKSDNVATMLSDEELSALGNWCFKGYSNDLSSRSDWEEKQAEALKIAMQTVEKKSFPWNGASNIKFPIITVAAMQFHARAYPALIDAPNIVHAQVIGLDPDGTNSARADRISTHMSYQVIHEDTQWEESQDKALLILPILGNVFKKTYFDPVAGHNVSELVLPKDFVINYWSKSIESSDRYTHVYHKDSNWVIEKIRRGIFLDHELVKTTSIPQSIMDDAKDKVQGTHSAGTEDLPFYFCEMNCWLDLDQDGYKEPYIVTFRYDTKQVFRIVARYMDDGDVIRKNDLYIRELNSERAKLKFESEKDVEIDKLIVKEITRLENDKNNQIIRINPIQYFTKYSFIPSPDGGFYDIGFGTLLAPMSDAIDTIINQHIDNGTIFNTSGGFLGKGVRLQKGQNTFSPFEWKPIDSVGDDLRKSIFPLPVHEPSASQFQLLTLLINYCERIAGSVDIMVGENPGQNTPAETSRTMSEQGMKTFSDIYKRVYRDTTKEFQKLYRLNEIYLEDNVNYINLTTGQGALIARDDYRKGDILVIPAADPAIASDAQKFVSAKTTFDVAMSQRGAGFNMEEVNLRMLRALKTKEMNKVYVGLQKAPPPPDPKVVLEQMKLQPKAQKVQMDARDKYLNFQKQMIELQQTAEKNEAEVERIYAETIKLLAEAEGVDTGHQIAILETQLGAAKQHQTAILDSLKLMQQHLKETNSEEGGMAGMETGGRNEGNTESSQ